MYFKYVFLVKDGVFNLRNEDVEIVEINDIFFLVLDVFSRILYVMFIYEEDEDDIYFINKSIFFFFIILDYFYSVNLDFSYFYRIC